MRRCVLFVLAVLLLFSLAIAQQAERVPLVTLELPASAVAYHLGLRSWAFAYKSHSGGHIYAGLSYYKRSRTDTFERTDFGQFSVENDPLGQQYLTVILGPSGKRTPVSFQINNAQFTSDIAEVDLNNFNSSASTTPNAVLPPVGRTGTFILLAHYPEKNGNVTATGKLEDMDAYLALEVGQTQP